jgi:hypothetical protein
MITGFVAAMMILVEYLNVLSAGMWQRKLCGSRWSQYLVAALLGAMPGCLGAFVVVALFIHRAVSLGALVACMIATSGDEAFVMLTMFPGAAVKLTTLLVVVGVIAGLATDLVLRPSIAEGRCSRLALHDDEETCRCFDAAALPGQLRRPTPARGLLAAGTGLLIVALAEGVVGPTDWSWVRITMVAVASVTFLVVVTVPDHFLEEHLWRHVVLDHVPRLFVWTFGAMAVILLLDRHVEVEAFIRTSRWFVLAVAGAVGVVPESGPHLVFVTLFDHGSVPFGVLAASSIVQDGHGMLPLLAHSWRDVLKVKAINLVVGLTVGALLLVLGH